MSGALAFKRATRVAVKLKVALQGPSGSGKTLGALHLATGLAAGQRIAVIDTENGSASLYADRFDFDTLELRPPYTSKRYLEAVRAAVAAGYGAVVIDSLSHQWEGEGGILARKEEVDKRGGNSYTNWAEFTKEHELFKAGLLNADVHIVATIRTKQDYVLEQNEKGKQQPKKVGTKPIQREGMEYEFTLVFELQMDHRAAASKDRTGLFDAQLVDLLQPDPARRLMEWLASGAAAAPAKPTLVTDGPTARTETQPATEDDDRLTPAKALPFPFTKSPFHGKPIGELETSFLQGISEWAFSRQQEENHTRFASLLSAIALVLAEREREQTSLDFDDDIGEGEQRPDPTTIGASQPSTNGSAASSTSKQGDAPAPDKLEDEIDASDPLIADVQDLLKHPAIGEQLRVGLKRQLAGGLTPTQLAATKQMLTEEITAVKKAAAKNGGKIEAWMGDLPGGI